MGRKRVTGLQRFAWKTAIKAACAIVVVVCSETVPSQDETLPTVSTATHNLCIRTLRSSRQLHLPAPADPN